MADVSSVSEESFNRTLVDSVEETIGAILGINVAKAFRYHLYAYLGVSREDIPSHLEKLAVVLNGSFGVAGPVLGRAIIRRLSAKLGLSLVQKSDCSLVLGVEELKKLYLMGAGNSC